jgi:mono/diheme cytochrome c family protein
MRQLSYIALLILACTAPAYAHEPCEEKIVETSYTLDLKNGERIYKRHCVQCHEADGRGYRANYAPNWRKDTSRLQKSDEELLKSINDGVGALGIGLWIMPPWGNYLIEDDQKDVLAYIRDAFQEKL